MTAPVGCLYGEQAIRDALAAGPTPGPWLVDQDTRPGMRWNRSISTEDGANWLCTMMHSGGKAPQMDEANADLIAACNPKTMRALLAELDRLRSASRQEGWQPIETAPKSRDCGDGRIEGVYILGFCPDPDVCNLESAVCVVWWEPLMNKGRGMWYGEGGFETHPTHWQPMPSAPHQSQEAQGDRHG